MEVDSREGKNSPELSGERVFSLHDLCLYSLSSVDCIQILGLFRGQS